MGWLNKNPSISFHVSVHLHATKAVVDPYKDVLLSEIYCWAVYN